MTDIERNLFHEFWRTYNLATDEGIKQGKEPDELFREALRHNNGVFAAFKVHRMQNDMARQLLNPDGSLKPFEQWKNDVRSIATHQCSTWLQTEYNTAVLRARQAANWQQFQAEADVLPNLKWIPSTSPNPGADHRPFWGTVLPIDHPFWTKHRPGDRWNCKCDLSNTDEPATTAPDGSPVGNNPHPGLDNNPGIDAKLFSDTHPYIANAYPGAQQAVERVVRKEENKEIAANLKKIKKQIDQYQGVVVKDEKYITGQIRLLRRSLTDIFEHDREDAVLMTWLCSFDFKDLKGWRYEGWAKNRPYEPNHPKFNPQKPDTPKHPETLYFLYYSKTINGKKYWANVKMHKDYNGEVLYTIEPKAPEDLIKGIPPK